MDGPQAESSPDIPGWLLELIGQALQETGAEMTSLIIESLSTECNGEHAPIGEPPYKETGTLIASVSYDVSTTSENEMQLTIGAGPAIAEDGYDYSIDLEKGTGKMKGPRPYILNRIEEAREMFIKKVMAQ